MYELIQISILSKLVDISLEVSEETRSGKLWNSTLLPVSGHMWVADYTCDAGPTTIQD